MRLNKNMKGLKAILNDVPNDRKAIADSLFEELRFIQNILESLKKQVLDDGAVTEMINGEQKLLIQHPAFKGYTTMIQRYNLILKQIIDLLPVAVAGEKDELLEFIK